MARTFDEKCDAGECLASQTNATVDAREEAVVQGRSAVIRVPSDKGMSAEVDWPRWRRRVDAARETGELEKVGLALLHEYRDPAEFTLEENARRTLKEVAYLIADAYEAAMDFGGDLDDSGVVGNSLLSNTLTDLVRNVETHFEARQLALWIVGFCLARGIEPPCELAAWQADVHFRVAGGQGLGSLPKKQGYLEIHSSARELRAAAFEDANTLLRKAGIRPVDLRHKVIGGFSQDNPSPEAVRISIQRRQRPGEHMEDPIGEVASRFGGSDMSYDHVRLSGEVDDGSHVG